MLLQGSKHGGRWCCVKTVWALVKAAQFGLRHCTGHTTSADSHPRQRVGPPSGGSFRLGANLRAQAEQFGLRQCASPHR
eukprot:14681134-Alexandrium_andersonii.AAC.1